MSVLVLAIMGILILLVIVVLKYQQDRLNKVEAKLTKCVTEEFHRDFMNQFCVDHGLSLRITE